MRTTERRRAAAAWVEKAIDAGMDPQVVIQPDGRHGLYCLEVEHRTLPLPSDDQCKQVNECLFKMGRVLMVSARGRIAPVGPKPEGAS